MVQPLSSPQDRLSAFGITAGCVAVAVLGGAVVLWVHYGTAVFFEMISAGLQSCF